MNENSFWSLSLGTTLKIKVEKMNKKYGYTMYPVHYTLEVLLLRNRGVIILLPHLRAMTVLTTSYVFGNQSREDGDTVNQIRPEDQGFYSCSGKHCFLL